MIKVRLTVFGWTSGGGDEPLSMRDVRQGRADTRSTRRHQHAVVLDAVKAKPAVAAGAASLDSISACRPRRHAVGAREASGGIELGKCWVAVDGRRLGLRCSSVQLFRPNLNQLACRRIAFHPTRSVLIGNLGLQDIGIGDHVHFWLDTQPISNPARDCQ